MYWCWHLHVSLTLTQSSRLHVYCYCVSLYILFLIHVSICTLSRCGLSTSIKVLIDWLIDWPAASWPLVRGSIEEWSIWWAFLSVCLCVCLSAIISSELHVRTSPIFLCMLPFGVARSSSGGVVINYVLPVLWMTSCLLISQGCSTSPTSWSASHTQPWAWL